MHAKQKERIAVTSGELTVIVGKEPERTLRAGEEVLLAPGVPHVWWNPGDEPVEVEIEYEPALNTEEFFESFFALGRDGKTTTTGAPRFLQLVVMARHFEIYDAAAPIWLQRAVCAVLEPIAHALGYRAYYGETGTAGPRLTGAPVSH
jgi:hypothetical protein